MRKKRVGHRWKMFIDSLEYFDTKKAVECIKNKEIIEFKEKTLVLASASKTRYDLLKKENIDFVVIPNILDEEKIKHSFSRVDTIEAATEYVKTLAEGKALSIAQFIKNGIILSADTVAYYKDEILEKPKDEADARRIFKKISNSTHEVITGVSIFYKDKIDTFAVISPIKILKISEGRIEELVNIPETYLYAGGYRIDDNFAGNVIAADEDFDNIMGLPLKQIKEKMILTTL